jgi:hypothetical protein
MGKGAHRYGTALAVLASGCSFFMTPPPTTPVHPVKCTSGRGLPLLDTLVALPLTALFVAALVDYASPCVEAGDFLTCGQKRNIDLVIAIPSALLGTTLSIAAVTGFSRASRCETMEKADRQAHPAPGDHQREALVPESLPSPP